MRELFLGAGNSLHKRVRAPDAPEYPDEPVTLDIDPQCKPDVIHDLNVRPLPFKDLEFDEIHAYEVLEHIGTQGDWRGFFEEWNEYHRILRPGGLFCGTCPSAESRWCWGDPGHTRVIMPETFVFLNQEEYRRQVGHTPMTDYRAVYQGDFRLLFSSDNGDTYSFALERV